MRHARRGNHSPDAREIDALITDGTLVVCHKNGLKRGWDKRWIRLWMCWKLFAFIRPAQMISPTPPGSSQPFASAPRASPEDKVLTIARAATHLLDELAEMPAQTTDRLAEIAEMMRRGAGDGRHDLTPAGGQVKQKMPRQMAGPLRCGAIFRKFLIAVFAHHPLSSL